ncbi:phosphonate ABC transporter, permease protein PhnE [Lactiplantibacillus argentoratensis]|uniref:Phosphonate ABC transporter, permease protein PhnE n=1 Tax=Lactiplantibacillus argentoratensis TaxID=271881 RepID=A0ABS5UET5_9LACO|nr:phosphonate ABC transporter, permease protein PhnE [Lactiplantibacillus argentoratensis]MBT1137092.1 phosphonate ABC transporter, permease protein PhnE [Lactiplantibacillus argentoratensis]MBT1139954.1 phosphonate ABC transporter, permease protein PhnE [Lactiplantibacillus argentoratensis]MCA5598271.1 phosphonate ABC transporter, permease protein PhnE [Lactiplantibacillus argentoratensis]
MKTNPMTPQRFFRQRRLRLSVVLLILIGIYVLSMALVNFQVWASISKIPAGLMWLFTNFIPTSRSISYLGPILYQLWRTLLVAISSTMVASLFALIFAILGAKTTTPTPVLRWIIRFGASLLRNIPVVAWAMILLFSFKQSDFTGFLALFFMTLGYLTRAFTETIEDLDAEKLQALQAVGANYFQCVFCGVLPEAASTLTSWILYMIENNLRDATLVGLLTGTGVGFLFDYYFKAFRYDAAGLIVLLIAILVIVLELTSNRIRRAIA